MKDAINSSSDLSPACGAPRASTIFVMVCYQSADADDRVVDVLGELVSHRGSNFVIAAAVMTIGSGEALEIGDRFDVPNDEPAHADIEQISHTEVYRSARMKKPEAAVI